MRIKKYVCAVILLTLLSCAVVRGQEAVGINFCDIASPKDDVINLSDFSVFASYWMYSE